MVLKLDGISEIGDVMSFIEFVSRAVKNQIFFFQKRHVFFHTCAHCRITIKYKYHGIHHEIQGQTVHKCKEIDLYMLLNLLRYLAFQRGKHRYNTERT